MSKVISAKVDDATEQRFAALAASQGKTKNWLLKDLILNHLGEPRNASKLADGVAGDKTFVIVLPKDRPPQSNRNDDAQPKVGKPLSDRLQGRPSRAVSLPNQCQPVDHTLCTRHEKPVAICHVNPFANAKTSHHSALFLQPERRCQTCVVPREGRTSLCSEAHQPADQQ